VDHIIKRRLWALEEMVERFCRSEISDDCKYHLAFPNWMCFDNIIRFFLGAHRRSHGVSALLDDQSPVGI